MNEAVGFWSTIHHILEALGVIFIPFMGWVMMTIISHSKQIIILEEKVNDSLNRRMVSLESRMVGMEERLEAKIDSIENNVVECKLKITEKANVLNMAVDKIEKLITKLS